MKPLLSIAIVLLAAAISDAGGLVYVAHTASQRVGVYDPALSKMVGSITVGPSPSNLTVSPDGRLLAVSHQEGSTERPDVIWIIGREDGRVIKKVDIHVTRYRARGEIFLAFSKDGKKLYAVDSSTGFLDVIDAGGWMLVKKVSLGASPQDPALSPDGRRLYIPCMYSRRVEVVDTESDSVIGSIPVDGLPSGAAVSADGGTLYVTDMDGHRVLFIDIETRSVAKAVPVGTSPRAITLPDDRYLYVLNMHSNNLSIVDTVAGECVKTHHIGVLPRKMAYDPGGKKLFTVSRDANIIIIDTATRAREKGLGTDIWPEGMVYAPPLDRAAGVAGK